MKTMEKAKSGDWFVHYNTHQAYYVGLVVRIDPAQMDGVDELVVYGDMAFDPARPLIAKNADDEGLPLYHIKYFAFTYGSILAMPTSSDNLDEHEFRWNDQYPLKLWARSSDRFNGFVPSGEKRFRRLLKKIKM